METRNDISVTGEPGPDDRVTVRGIEMTLATAERQGHVRRENGKYVDTNPEAFARQQKAAAEAAQQQREAGTIAVDAETQQDLSKLFWPTPRDRRERARRALPSAHPAGPAARRAEAHCRDQPGVSPEALHQRMTAIAADIEIGLGDWLLTAGISAEQIGPLWTWMKTSQAGACASAVLQAVVAANAAPLRSLVRQYVAGHGSGRGSVPAQKVEVVKVGERMVETVNVPGRGRVSLEAARRLGLV